MHKEYVARLTYEQVVHFVDNLYCRELANVVEVRVQPAEPRQPGTFVLTLAPTDHGHRLLDEAFKNGPIELKQWLLLLSPQE